MIQEFHRSRWINSSFSNFALRFIFGTFAERKRVVFFHFLREKNYVCAFMHYKVELYFHIFFVTGDKVTFDLCKYLVDEWILVSEEEISRAVYQFMENHHKVSQLHFFYCLKIFQLHFFFLCLLNRQAAAAGGCGPLACLSKTIISPSLFSLPLRET